VIRTKRIAITIVVLHLAFYLSVIPIASQIVRYDPWYGSKEGWYVSTGLISGYFAAFAVLFLLSPLPPFSSILIAWVAVAFFKSARWQALSSRHQSLLLHVALCWTTFLLGANVFLSLNFIVQPDATSGVGLAVVTLLKPLYYPLYAIAMVNTGALLLILAYCGALGSILGYVLWRVRSSSAQNVNGGTA
jgi:hypothetical protein